MPGRRKKVTTKRRRATKEKTFKRELEKEDKPFAQEE